MSGAGMFVMDEGLIRLPKGWAGRTQTIVHQTEGGGSLVTTFAPAEESFDDALDMAAKALPEFVLVDRRTIEIDGRQGDFAEITFSTQAEALHQMVVRLPMETGRAVTFHLSVRKPMTEAMRRTLLETIFSFQFRSKG